MIDSFKLSHLRNNELLQFFNDVLNRCMRYDINALMIQKVFNALKKEVDKLKSVFNKEIGSELTELLVELDAYRDSDITGIKMVCEGFAYHRNREISDAAKLILDSFNNYSNPIAKLNYPAQTTVVNSITAKWNDESKLKAAFETLNLIDWASMLKSSNNKFSNTYQDRVDDKLASATDSFSELRAGGIITYKALCDNIFAHSVIDNNVEYTNLMNALNVIIADYDTIISKRLAAKAE